MINKLILGNKDPSHFGLQLPESPQWGQESSTEGHSQRQLDGGGPVAQVCVAAWESAGVSSTDEGSVHGFFTDEGEQAAPAVQSGRPGHVKRCFRSCTALLFAACDFFSKQARPK